MKEIIVLFIQRPDAEHQNGGDTLHLQATLQAVKARGLTVQLAQPKQAKTIKAQIIHAFNLGKPQNILPLIKHKKAFLVLSSVFVDYEATAQRSGRLTKFVGQVLGADALEYLKSLVRWLKKQEPWPGWYYLLMGHRSSVLRVLENCDLLITASDAEYQIIKNRYSSAKKQVSIALGVEHFPQASSPKKRTGVLCAARIEPLKNQLNLIKACQNLGLKLSIAGSPSRNHKSYFKACQNASHSTTQWLGYLKPNELARAMAETEIHALPSFYESTGLSTLEALKNGCKIVVSENPISLELFKNNAHYCLPQSVSSIEQALQKALDQKPRDTAAVMNLFSWSLAAEKLEHLYSDLCSTKKV